MPASHLRALADAGLFGIDGVDGATRWEVYETLAGACGVTFFVWVQHHAPVRLLQASPNTALRDRWLPPLRSGDVLGGVAFAHLRRPGPPAVTATPAAGGGYVFEGEAPYVTSWGLAGLLAVAALTPDERVVFAAVPADTPGLRPSPPLRLAAMNASSTVRLGLDGVAVPAGDVIDETPLADWQRRDRAATAPPSPAPFGVAATAVRLLAERDEAAAAALDGERAHLRAAAFATDRTDLDTLVDLRARSLELALRASHALVVATGGRSMALSHPAQRLLREAGFYAIQAQTGALRAATLEVLTAPR